MTKQKDQRGKLEFDLEPVKQITFYAAGVQFQKGWRDKLASLKEGDKLYFMPEPTNKYDENAIQILNSAHIFLGYVPAKGGETAKNLWVLDRLFEGQNLKATAKEINTEFDPWQALLVEVEIVEASL